MLGVTMEVRRMQLVADRGLGALEAGAGHLGDMRRLQQLVPRLLWLAGVKSLECHFDGQSWLHLKLASRSLLLLHALMDLLNLAEVLERRILA